MRFIRYTIMIIVASVLGLLIRACGGSEEPTPIPETSPPTEELSSEPTVVPTEEPAPEPADEPEPSEEPTAEPPPEPTEEPVPVGDFVEFTAEVEGLTLGYPADWVYDDTFFLIFASSEELMMEMGPNDDSAGAMVMALVCASETRLKPRLQKQKSFSL